MPTDPPYSDDDFDAPPSKSELKRQMQELQRVGEQLLALSDGDLARIPLPEELAEALATAKRIKSREGLRRQMQYIGKVMRRIDAEPILEALAERERGQQELARRFHELENWRDRLIAEGQGAVNELKAEFPAADRQKLRQLVRNAQKEKQANQPPASSRKLFRYLRELLQEQLES